MSNNGGAESYPFMSKKRSLEGGGTNNPERYLATICLHREADFLVFSDGPEVKKVASQSEIDSSLCMFEKSIAILL